MGSHQTIGSVFADNKSITMGPGDTLQLTGSDYANDYIYHLSWSGGNGTATLLLPETDPSNVSGREAHGYKRMIRFICDNTVNSNDKIRITAQPGDSVDGASGGWFEVKRAFEGVMLYSPISGSWYVMQEKA